MDNLMTLEEVAAYLRVSERTVKEWASAGELPGGKLGGTWRFRKQEINNWLDWKLTPHKHSKHLSFDYSPETLLDPSRIYLTDVDSKTELLNVLVDKATMVPGVTSREEIADALFKREALMSTGIGLGVAVPHVRLNNVHGLNVFMAVNKTDITDYDTLDDKPVRVALFFVVGRNQHSEYIKALSVLAQILKNDLIFKQILDSDDAAQVYTCFNQVGGQ